MKDASATLGIMGHDGNNERHNADPLWACTENYQTKTNLRPACAKHYAPWWLVRLVHVFTETLILNLVELQLICQTWLNQVSSMVVIARTFSND